MKLVFRATYSTLSPVALAEYITGNYGFTNVYCTFLVRGVGDTYLVESNNGKYILRIYRHAFRTLNQIQAEAQLLITLNNNDVSVSYPIVNLQGEHVQWLEAAEGTRYAMLFTYAEGQPAIIFTHNQLVNLGREMAKFHNVSSSIQPVDGRWPFNIETTLTKPLQAIQHVFDDNKEDYEWLQNAALQAQQKISAANAAGFAEGYCHFDLLPKNFHFVGDKLTFFDFDFFGYGWLVNDVMIFWLHLCLDVQLSGRLTQQQADEAFAAFVQAYRDIRPLGAQELSLIPWLSIGFWLFYMQFHTTHDQFYPFIHPAHVKLRVALLKKLDGAYCNEKTAQKLAIM